MRIKRFSARDLTAATNMIKDEFGLAAIILSQRELSAEQGGGVEITAGVREEDLPENQKSAPEAAEPAPAAPRARPKTPPAAVAHAYLRQEAAAPAPDKSGEIKRSLEELGDTLGRSVAEIKTLILNLAHRQNLAEQWRERPDLIHLYRRLLDDGVSAAHARDLVESAAGSALAWGGEVLEHLRKTMRPKLRLADSAAPPGRLALVGPSGAGKTSALVNLAAFFRLRGRKVAVASLDTLRLGAAEQLTQYARILGVALKVCQNRETLLEALDIFESEDLVLIDTPGRAFQQKDLAAELGDALAEVRAQALLVLPATMKTPDLAAALRKARAWPLFGVVVSKFDETAKLGNLVDFILEAVPELAFFSTGPKTPDDFRPAEAEYFLDLWLAGAGMEPERADE